MIKVYLKEGFKEYQEKVSCFKVAQDISEGLARVALCAKLNGELVDLSTIIESDSKLEIITFNDEEGKEVYRHTTSHILAQAVKNIYPTVKLGIGPAIANGFYYDFDFQAAIVFEDLEKIENEMKEIIKADYLIEKVVLTKKEAIKLMQKNGENYKVEIINSLEDNAQISFYKQGNFIDLCKGPHVRSTGQIKNFKLTSLTGAYWRGNEKNKMLSRIYGTCFEKKSDLKEYLAALEEAKRRDHNKIGRELNYFMTDENIGQGLPLLMPKGAKLFQILNRFIEDLESERGYVLTKTPYMAKNNLYKISGHWDHYKEGMFVIGDEEKDSEILALRPMTCPFQYTIYNNGLKSYRNLPIRYAETSTLFRNESSGEMHGLIRIRQFTLSEGHIICTPEQLKDEFNGVVDLIFYILDVIGLKDDVTFRFSKHNPNNKEKYIDNPQAWESAEATMKDILDDLKIEYKEAIGEAAFYGPKLDIQIKNVYGKEDTIITVQVDMFLAENFDMSYIDENGEKKRPYIIHRSSIGCYERTIALLLEKYAGNLPFWLSPTQAVVMSVTDRTSNYANEFTSKLKKLGFRVEQDSRNETIGYKIRAAKLEKVPFMIIIGDKEAEQQMVSIRSRDDKVEILSIEDLINKFLTLAQNYER